MNDNHITMAYLENQFDDRPTLDNALMIWQFHRQTGLDLPANVRARLDNYLDVEAKRRIERHRNQGFTKHDKKYRTALWRALYTDEILSFVADLKKKESEKSLYWFNELKMKYRKIPCFKGKTTNWWRQYYYKLKHYP